ncbi:hypothetical protein FWC31_04080 [Candidatus Saccharibacteria bacterium]|nr:hypothetical protein [Candidatus Saccharibacteria bacterium]
MKGEKYLTKQKLLEMQVELNYLTECCDPKIEKLLDRTRSVNCLSWSRIRNEQVLIKKRIVELTTQIRNASITEDVMVTQ